MNTLTALLIVSFVLATAESAKAVEIFAVCASRDATKSDLPTRLDSSHPQALTTFAETKLSMNFPTGGWKFRRD